MHIFMGTDLSETSAYQSLNLAGIRANPFLVVHKLGDVFGIVRRNSTGDKRYIGRVEVMRNLPRTLTVRVQERKETIAA